MEIVKVLKKKTVTTAPSVDDGDSYTCVSTTVDYLLITVPIQYIFPFACAAVRLVVGYIFFSSFRFHSNPLNFISTGVFNANSNTCISIDIV